MPMHDRLYRLGGISFVVAGGLLLAKNALEVLAGAPPPGGPELFAWAVSRRNLFAGAVEIFFFAVVFLTLGSWHCTKASPRRTGTAPWLAAGSWRRRFR